MRLLVRREHIDYPVNGFCRALGMKGAKNQMARGSGFQSQLNGFQIPHFTNEYDIRVFPQSTAQGRFEPFCVHSHFPVIHNTALAFMNKFNWVFNGNNMAFLVSVDVVHHGGKCGRFAASRGAGDQNHSLMQHGKFGDDFGKTQLLSS